MAERSALAQWSRVGFAISAWIFLAGVVAQVFLAGLGTFDGGTRWSEHVAVGQWIGTFSVLMLGFALLGRLPRLTIAGAAAVFLLYGLQYPLANAGAGWIAALHPVNALLLFWLTLRLAQARGARE